MSNSINHQRALDALIATAGPAKTASQSRYFTAQEASTVEADGQNLWSNGHWLLQILSEISTSKNAGEWPFDLSFEKLDTALAEVVKSAFWIGAASVVHPANIKHINLDKMEGLRAALKEKNSSEYEAITNAVLRAAQAVEQNRKVSSVHKLAASLYPAVKKHLSGSGYEAGVSTIARRLEELIETNRLLRSNLME